MSSMQRIANILVSLLMIACGIILLFDSQNGLEVVAIILGLAIVLYGIRSLVYYLTMTRHMVGGLSVLFIAVISLDIGVFALALSGDPRLSIVLYLVSYNVYTGILAIARGIEAKLHESRWIPSVVHGVVNIALAVLCLVFVGSDRFVLAIFCIGLFYSAAYRLISAFKPTEIIYIQ